MKIRKTKVASACVPILLCASVSSTQALPVPGGTLDPLTIPKYVTDLTIPPVLYDDFSGWRPLDVEIALRQIDQQVLPPGFPATPLWAYGDPRRPNTFSNPSGTIEVTKDTMAKVKWSNQLVLDPEECFDDNGHGHNGHGHKGMGRGKGKGKGNNKDNPACEFLTHVIKDQEGTGVPIIDQTLHWAAPGQNCLNGIQGPDGDTDCRGDTVAAYLGPIPMVNHVHGAHVGPGSDGFPEAWWLPDATNIDCTNVAGYPQTANTADDYDCNGTFFESADGADTLNALGEGYAIDIYSNDQPTSTLWYHDHTLGMTRLNVYAAGAGFWLIRDRRNGETGLESGRLPRPAPFFGVNPNGTRFFEQLTRKFIREIPIAIQPKSFNANGTQYYPAEREFFEQGDLPTDVYPDNDGQNFAANDRLNIPFLPQTNSDIAPVWNPEAFFNTMVVNGRTWPQFEVASERYRFRLLNAADSRFLNLALFEVVDAGPDGNMGTADDTLGAELPFYQIGAEQSLLPQVVRVETGFATPLPGDGSDVGNGVMAVPAEDIDGPTPDQALLVGPAERADVIVDFTGLPNGTVVRMTNTAPDAPFGGFGDPVADPATTGQVMQFVVNTNLNYRFGDRSTHPADLVFSANPGGVEKLLDPGTAPQDLALLEEESALVCAVFDATTETIEAIAIPPGPNFVTECEAAGGAPFGPQAAVLGTMGSMGGEVQLWDDPITTNPASNTVENWDLWNWSADAHPIHLHLVKFQVVSRASVNGYDPANPPADGTGIQPWENGWKDTVIAYPDQVTRIRAKFDIDGLYVWHCHILSHEDNEMMVPYCVGPAADDPLGPTGKACAEAGGWPIADPLP